MADLAKVKSNVKKLVDMGAPESDIDQYIAEEGVTLDAVRSYKEPSAPAQDMDRLEAGLRGAARGAPFGTDIQAFVQGGFSPDRFPEEKKDVMQQLDVAREMYPMTTGAGEIGATLGTAFLTPAKVLQGASMASRAIKAGALGGALGFGYGAQEGDTIGERVGQGIKQGVIDAPMAAGGSVALDVLMGGAKAAAPGVSSAINRFTKFGQTSGNMAEQSLRTGADINQALQQGRQIPLTKGQALQDPRMQALEYGSQAGQYGEEAQKIALQGRELQSDAAKQALSRVAGDEITETTSFTAAENILSDLKDAYKKAKQNTSKEYEALGELSDQPLRIGAEYIKEGIIPSIKQWARKGTSGTGFDLIAPGMENARRLYNQASNFGDFNKITSVNLNKMEQWRGRVSQGIANAKEPSERAFLSGMLQRYDDAMSVLPREAIKSGDERILRQLETARGARATQGRLFERNKLVADILEKDSITNEQFANLIFGKGKAINKDAALRLESIQFALKDKSPEVTEQLKKGMYSNILKNSLSSELKTGGAAEELISFNKLASNLNELVTENPTLFKKLHPTTEERQAVLGLLEDVKKVKSVQPGSKNYSNTAYTLINALREVSPGMSAFNVPLVGSPTSILKEMAQEGATTELKQSLNEVLKMTLDELNEGAFNFAEKYGRRSISAIAPSGTREMKE